MRTKTLLLLAIGLLSSTAVFADGVTFVGASGPVVGGVYVAPYQIQDTSINGGATINVICDDYGDHVTNGETYVGQTETFSADGTLSPGALYASQPNANFDYDFAAVLYSGFLNGSADAAGTNYAIWGLFDPSLVGTSAYESTDAAALTAGVTFGDLIDFDYSSYEVITPTVTGDSEPQEFLYQDTASPTPEPGTLVLFGSGMLGLAGIVRRKLNLKKEN